jgi:hypothetical protein
LRKKKLENKFRNPQGLQGSKFSKKQKEVEVLDTVQKKKYFSGVKTFLYLTKYSRPEMSMW